MLASGTGPPSRFIRRFQSADKDIDGKDYPGE
ncbi:hypothetical protein [Klebsiella variicola]